MTKRLRFVATGEVHRFGRVESTDPRIHWTICGQRYCPDHNIPKTTRAEFEASPKCSGCYDQA